MDFDILNDKRFSIITNKLLNSTYLLKEQNRDEYAFISVNFNVFEEYLQHIGYTIKKYDLQGVIQLINLGEFGNKIKLKKTQSIILLLLRILYLEEKMKLNENANVQITVGRLQDKYSILNIINKKNLDVNSIKESLRLFKSYNLIDYPKGLNTEKNLEDFVITIFYTVCLTLNLDDVETILKATNEKLASYNMGDEKNEISED